MLWKAKDKQDDYWFWCAQSYLRLWWRSEWTCRNCISVIPKSFWVRLLQRTAPDCRGFQMKSWKSMEWLLVRCAQLYLRLFLGQTAVPLTCTSLQVAVVIVLGMTNWRLTEWLLFLVNEPAENAFLLLNPILLGGGHIWPHPHVFAYTHVCMRTHVPIFFTFRHFLCLWGFNTFDLIKVHRFPRINKSWSNWAHS